MEPEDRDQKTRRTSTETSAFGAGRRENHDSREFYRRFPAPVISPADTLSEEVDLPEPPCIVGDSRTMSALPNNSVALVVTSPPYFVGKEYEQAVAGDEVAGSGEIPATYIEFLAMLRGVFAECHRVLEPGGRIAVNVANLGRKPYRSLAADVIRILQDDLGMLLRGEIVWQKAEGASGSVAWGSFRKAANPVLRDITERVIVASKGRFDRARSAKQREAEGRPHVSTITTDEFMEATLDVWRIDSESARRVQHPAPFPVELPRRLIDLYTYQGDIVLDPFLGAGTTLVAAERTGRRGIGYDLDPKYVDIATRRLEAERAKRRVRPSGGEGEMLSFDLPDQSEERIEHFQARATSEGKKAQDLARQVLESCGFRVVDESHKIAKTGVQFNFLIEDAAGEHIYYVDVSGAFTTVRPGLMRTDTLWKTLGRAHVLMANANAASDANHPRLLVLTSNLPRANSPGDRALRAVGAWNVFDAVEMFDHAGVARLQAYAAGARSPLPGFWTEPDIELFEDFTDPSTR
ncbi:MAG: site-specific DNA-methyltransferase [bacterium]|nr:site-specific DNA-methyltransferase [bacterium]